MPRYEKVETGRTYRIRKIKTFGDKLKEGVATVGGITVFLWLLSIAFG